jgi:hypothetical protein
MLRIPFAAVAFVGSIFILGTASNFGEKWQFIGHYVGDREYGRGFQIFLTDFWPPAIGGAILFVLAIFILAWPAKRRATSPTSNNHEASATPEKQTVS